MEKKLIIAFEQLLTLTDKISILKGRLGAELFHFILNFFFSF